MIQSIVFASLVFTYFLVKMCIRHSENLERIKHGYPLADGTRPVDSKITEAQPFEFETKLQ